MKFLKTSKNLKVIKDGSSLYKNELPFYESTILIYKDIINHSFWKSKLQKEEKKKKNSLLQKYKRKTK